MGTGLEELTNKKICAIGFIGRHPDCTQDPVNNPHCSDYIGLHITNGSPDVSIHVYAPGIPGDGERHRTIELTCPENFTLFQAQELVISVLAIHGWLDGKKDNGIYFG